jgi:hypothetical protein
MEERSIMRMSWILCLLLVAGCSSSSNKDSGVDQPTGIPEAGYPDGMVLHPCTNPGGACNAHNACAIDPICGADKLCHPSQLQNCDDGLSCTQDICKGQGLCENVPIAGYCAVPVKINTGVDAGVPRTEIQCFKDGDRNPTDKCLVCHAASSDSGATGDPLHWGLANGGACDDGNACTKDDYCQSGVCKGEDFSKQCADLYSCTDDLCDGKGGCLGNKLKTDYCLINGECYKDQQQDAQGCNICDVKTSQNKWTALTVHCTIGGLCYKPGVKDSTGCGTCDPTKSTTDWTPMAGVCKIGAQCYQANAKHSQGCAICDPPTSGTTWTVNTDNCLIADTCYAPGTKDSTGCQTCDTSKSKTTWTQLTNQCVINSQCYSTGQKDPTGCAECDPTISGTSWTIKGANCLIASTCYQPGQSDSSGCGTCDPTKSKTSWTPVVNKCLIGAKCYKDTDPNPLVACLICNYAKNPKGWTPITGAKTTSYDFEDGKNPPTSWKITNTDAKAGWVVTNKRPGAGAYSLYYGDPSVMNYSGSGSNSGTAELPPVTLTAGKKSGLSFLVWMETETGNYYDTLEVYVGATRVWEKDGTSPTGSTVTQKTWQEITVDLSAYAGQTITIKFVFDTGDSISNSTEGAYVDNIVIYDNC